MVRVSSFQRVRPRYNTGIHNEHRERTRNREGIESSTWRLSLHTAYVANLDRQVSSRDLWRLFNAFGVVVDVFIPTVSNARGTRYAFIRYRFREELQRAVLEGNELKAACRKLVVRNAKERKKVWEQRLRAAGLNLEGRNANEREPVWELRLNEAARNGWSKPKGSQGGGYRQAESNDERVTKHKGGLKGAVISRDMKYCRRLDQQGKNRGHKAKDSS